MRRRLAPVLAIVAIAVVAGCNSTPAPSPISDPKEILTRTVLALKDVKTLDARGEVTGQVAASGSSFDLKGTSFELAADLPGKRFKASASIPAFLNTSLEAIGVDRAVYYKVLGPLAATLNADTTGKYRRVDAPSASGAPGEVANDPLKAIDEFKAALDKLPSAPVKGPNEKIGDQDTYHVTMKMTSQELQAISPTAGSSLAAMPFTLTVDVWSRTNDLRPARLALGVDGGTQGAAQVTIDFTYDVNISIQAPPADQVAP